VKNGTSITHGFQISLLFRRGKGKLRRLKKTRELNAFCGWIRILTVRIFFSVKCHGYFSDKIERKKKKNEWCGNGYITELYRVCSLLVLYTSFWSSVFHRFFFWSIVPPSNNHGVVSHHLDTTEPFCCCGFLLSGACLSSPLRASNFGEYVKVCSCVCLISSQVKSLFVWIKVMNHHDCILN